MSTKSQILICARGKIGPASTQDILLGSTPTTEGGRGGFYLNTLNIPPVFLPQGPTALPRANLDLGRCILREERSQSWSLLSALQTYPPLPCPSYHTEALPSHCFFLLTCLRATAACFLTALSSVLSLTWLYWWKISLSHTCGLCESCCCSGAQNKWDIHYRSSFKKI